MQKFSFLLLKIALSYFVIVSILLLPPVVMLLEYTAYNFAPPKIDVLQIRRATASALSIVVLDQKNDTPYSVSEVNHLVDDHYLLIAFYTLSGILIIVRVVVRNAPQWKDKCEIYEKPVLAFILISILCTAFFPVFFEAFHRILFPQGNYAFAENSILIQTFPPVFWLLEFLCLQVGVILLMLF